jgi:cell fate (sporulation/competence/biofilm development) regulator YlbF (YheA/YmcA/DUF963 family)
MDQELLDLATLVNEAIRQSPAYQAYASFSPAVVQSFQQKREEFLVFQKKFHTLQPDDQAYPESLQQLQYVKQQLDSDTSYQDYLRCKTAYRLYLKSVYQEIFGFIPDLPIFNFEE